MSYRTTVIADDFTGACEIAGIGHRHGLRSVVSLEPAAGPAAGELLVLDTETRLASPAEAAARLTEWSRPLGREANVFKKTDSVLRGPLAVELHATAAMLRRPRVLLVPANPALGRRIEGGAYLIHGVPLDRTAFGSDPHHPARSARVDDLLGDSGLGRAFSLPLDRPLPPAGLVVGEVANRSDLDAWARRLAPDVLPAGSAAFFEAVLENAGLPAGTAAGLPDQAGATLLISGTLVPEQRRLLDRFQAETLAADRLTADAIAAWCDRVAARLAATRAASAAVGGPRLAADQGADLVSPALGRLALGVAQRLPGPLHVIAEGGTTAAAIAAAFGWKRFTVRHEWSPGVVSVHPAGHPDILFTVKPGSYSWPAALVDRFGPPARNPVSA